MLKVNLKKILWNNGIEISAALALFEKAALIVKRLKKFKGKSWELNFARIKACVAMYLSSITLVWDTFKNEKDLNNQVWNQEE